MSERYPSDVPGEERPERFVEGADPDVAVEGDGAAPAGGDDAENPDGETGPPPEDFDPADAPSNPDLVGEAD